MSSETQNLKVGPCSITYKGELLGITSNSSTLSFNFVYYDVTCNKTHDQVLEKRLTGIQISFETEILQIDKGINYLLNENKTLTLDDLGKRQSPRGGELLIVPVSPHDKNAYRLPNALVVNQGELIFNNADEYILKLEFEANYNDGEEILIEYLDADTCQRESLQRDSISPASLERAMTAYIANKTNLVVDTNIFRGNLPTGIDGSAVIMHKREAVEYGMSQCYRLTFISMDKSRDVVMSTIHQLRDSLPVYG
ncbi:MAG: hypothetical protein KAS17_09255, partial [Victivallaceae bacterium]|nr:hypothetical protein [Victivallaceae bacterium]